MSEFLVPMSSPDITAVERKAVADVLDTPVLSMGPHLQAFEQAVADYISTKHAISVNSGTAGLHLCIRAAGVEAGDIVLTTPFSFVASSNAVLFEDAIPVFVDVEPHSGNMDVHQAARAVHDLSVGKAAAKQWLPRTGSRMNSSIKAILPVDVFGQPYDAEPLIDLASQFGLKIIEDACEAIGARHQDRMAGTLGDHGVFAFYPNKQMTTGEGGVIVTDDDQAAELMRALRNQGRAPGDTWLAHTHLGYNYRMDEMSAALGVAQLGRLDEMLDKRDRVARWYAERLDELPLVETPQVQGKTTRMSWFVYVVRLAGEVDRDQLIINLAENGIPSRPYFAPIHLQPFMVERFGYQAGDFPVTEDLGQRSLALPFSGVMTEKQVELVCSILRNVLAA